LGIPLTNTFRKHTGLFVVVLLAPDVSAHGEVAHLPAGSAVQSSTFVPFGSTVMCFPWNAI
jgi:hypothetical protein